MANGCGRTGNDAPAVQTPPPAQKPAGETEIVIPVEARPPFRGAISSHLDTVSRVEAEKAVQVMAEAVAECTSVNAEEGDRVKAGSILAELAKDEVRASISQAEVQVRQTKTSYDRAETAFVEGIGSEAERDSAKFAYEQAVAALETHKVQMAKRTLRAPINGIITQRNIQVGQMTAAGTPAFVIVDPSSFILTVNVAEKDRPRLNVGQTGTCTIDALGTQTFSIAVRRINPGIDAASGTVKVVLDFDAQTREQLHEAAFARVSLIMETRDNALLVPKEAVIEENARKYIFVVEEASDDSAPSKAAVAGAPADAPDKGQKPLTAKRVEIATGLEDAANIEVVSELDDNAMVVVLGQHALKTGAKVSITNTQTQLMKNMDLSPEEAIEAAKSKADQADAQEGSKN